MVGDGRPIGGQLAGRQPYLFWYVLRSSSTLIQAVSPTGKVLEGSQMGTTILNRSIVFLSNRDHSVCSFLLCPLLHSMSQLSSTASFSSLPSIPAVRHSNHRNHTNDMSSLSGEEVSTQRLSVVPAFVSTIPLHDKTTTKKAQEAHKHLHQEVNPLKEVKVGCLCPLTFLPF